MTKIFLTVVLFLLALSILAWDTEGLLKSVDRNINLAHGIEIPAQTIQAWDFSKKTMDTATSGYALSVIAEPEGFIGPYWSWYKQDFAEDPFDGRIEVLVMGEPLPSPLMTLLLAIGTLGIIYRCRNKSSQIKI